MVVVWYFLKRCSKLFCSFFELIVDCFVNLHMFSSHSSSSSIWAGWRRGLLEFPLLEGMLNKFRLILRVILENV